MVANEGVGKTFNIVPRIKLNSNPQTSAGHGAGVSGSTDNGRSCAQSQREPPWLIPAAMANKPTCNTLFRFRPLAPHPAHRLGLRALAQVLQSVHFLDGAQDAVVVDALRAAARLDHGPYE